MAATLRLERLTDTATHRQRVQRVLEAAPQYSLVCDGHLPQANAGDELFESAPPGHDQSGKSVYMIREGDVDIGVIDLYRRWNAPNKIILGLFLLIETVHRRGIGARAFELIRGQLATESEFDTLRVAVVQANTGAHPFWRAMGFIETGEIKPAGSFTSPIIIYERPLRPPP
jgi:predicted acetyltransferase